jgi:hypothetical protein
LVAANPASGAGSRRDRLTCSSKPRHPKLHHGLVCRFVEDAGSDLLDALFECAGPYPDVGFVAKAVRRGRSRDSMVQDVLLLLRLSATPPAIPRVPRRRVLALTRARTRRSMPGRTRRSTQARTRQPTQAAG